MEPSKILNTHLLDIIFDGRNKEYGAYQLRKSYTRNLAKALVITSSILILLGSVFANIGDSNNKKTFKVVDTEMVQLKTEEVYKPPSSQYTPPPEVNQVRFISPKVVKDEEVKPEEKIQEIKEDQTISTKTVDSEIKIQIVKAPIEETGTQVVEVKKIDYENTIFTKVEVEAGFPGGEDAWRNYLRKTLNANTPVDYGASAGKYTIIVKFIVSKDGSLSDIKCENDPGFGMCDESIRVVRKTKNWIPAIQNGRNVDAYRRQPITFMVED